MLYTHAKSSLEVSKYINLALVTYTKLNPIVEAKLPPKVVYAPVHIGTTCVDTCTALLFIHTTTGHTIETSNGFSNIPLLKDVEKSKNFLVIMS